MQITPAGRAAFSLRLGAHMCLLHRLHLCQTGKEKQKNKIKVQVNVNSTKKQTIKICIQTSVPL